MRADVAADAAVRLGFRKAGGDAGRTGRTGRGELLGWAGGAVKETHGSQPSLGQTHAGRESRETRNGVVRPLPPSVSRSDHDGVALAAAVTEAPS